MKRSKLIFLILSILFLLAIILAALDMGRRTTPPWKKQAPVEQNGRV